MYLSAQDIQDLPRIKRLNIINSATGIKPANLVGTQSANGKDNLAIFSSVVHLGSNPALMGIIFRPQHEKPRDTYLNIKRTGCYTLNQIPSDMLEQAHYTSAKLPVEVSEFERCGFSPEYLDGFSAPYVKESQLKLGLEMVEEIPIKSNHTILMVGRVQHLYFPDEMMDAEGNLNLEKIAAAGIGGVNSYYSLKREQLFPYAHVEDIPKLD